MGYNSTRGFRRKYFNPDDEWEARWKDIEEEDWVDNPRTSGLKTESTGMRFQSYEMTYWDNSDYISIEEDKEPPPPPAKKHTPNFHKGYNPKQNFNKGNNKGRGNHNIRRR